MIVITRNTTYKITHFLDSNLKETKEAVESQQQIDERIAKEGVIGIVNYDHTHRKVYGFIPAKSVKSVHNYTLASKDLSINILQFSNGYIKYARKHKITTRELFEALRKNYSSKIVDNSLKVPGDRIYGFKVILFWIACISLICIPAIAFLSSPMSSEVLISDTKEYSLSDVAKSSEPKIIKDKAVFVELADESNGASSVSTRNPVTVYILAKIKNSENTFVYKTDTNSPIFDTYNTNDGILAINKEFDFSGVVQPLSVIGTSYGASNISIIRNYAKKQNLNNPTFMLDSKKSGITQQAIYTRVAIITAILLASWGLYIWVNYMYNQRMKKIFISEDVK